VLAILDRAESLNISNDNIENTRAEILQRQGHAEEASRIRRRCIDAGALHTAIYAAEAAYQTDALQDITEARRLLRFGIERQPLESNLIEVYLLTFAGAETLPADAEDGALVHELSRSSAFQKALGCPRCRRQLDIDSLVMHLPDKSQLDQATLLAVADNLETHEHPEKALDCLSALDENQFQTRRIRGNCHKRLGRYKEAISAFEDLLTLADSPQDKSICFNNMADVIHEQRDPAFYETGIDCSERALALRPKGFDWPKKHLTFFKLSLSPASKVAATIDELRARWQVGKKTLATAFSDIDDPHKSLAYFQTLDEGRYDTWRMRGICYQRLGRYAEAASSFEESLALAGSPRAQSTTLNSLAGLIRQQQDPSQYAQGIKYCERALAVTPENFDQPKNHLAFFKLSLCPIDGIKATIDELQTSWKIDEETLVNTFADISDEKRREVWRTVRKNWSKHR